MATFPSENFWSGIARSCPTLQPPMNAPVATHKTAGPATVTPFLGILIDTARMELRLPPEKVQRLRSLARMWSNKSSSTRKDLEHFLGHLSHSATVIRSGRTFLRQLFMLMSTIYQPHHHAWLNQAVRADIKWCETFLTDWNGTSLIPLSQPHTRVFRCLWVIWLQSII